MKPKKCKICKEKFIPKRPLQQVCSALCGAKYASNQKQKAWKKEKKVRKEKLKTRSEHLNELQRVFNKWIRERDKDEPCISCGKPNGGEQAGHYRSVGSSPELRFNEDNVHGQCVYCNKHLHANLIFYRKNLIKKIGIKAVEELERNHEPLKLSVDEIKKLKKKYKTT